jgi:hypothetical protein
MMLGGVGIGMSCYFGSIGNAYSGSEDCAGSLLLKQQVKYLKTELIYSKSSFAQNSNSS